MPPNFQFNTFPITEYIIVPDSTLDTLILLLHWMQPECIKRGAKSSNDSPEEEEDEQTVFGGKLVNNSSKER